jgi:D-arabinan exo alpha-(1,3)/(1,5)-arabinofuranosidase (non-reducing end)
MRARCTVCILAMISCTLAPSLLAQQKGEVGELDSLFQLRDNKTARISSYDRSGGNNDWVDVAPGETKTLAEIPGVGVIRRFYIAPFAFDRMRYRKLILRMYWDGQKEPCVEVPIGDLFGSGLGTLRYFHSLVVDVNPGYRGYDFDGMVSYFPMPFEKGARITLENDGNVPDFRIWYHIDYEIYSQGKLPPNTGRFHAQWRRVPKTPVREGSVKNSQLGNMQAKNTTGADNYLILDAKGPGSYVGFFLTIDNIAGGWYGEGDDMIFVDGAGWPPTYPGTGTEEIFNAGCCPNSEFFGLYTGFYLIENLNGDWGGKSQMYRFHLNDPVRFHNSIRVTMEHGHDNNFENDYTTTAFWYQQEPHEHFPEMPAASQRLPAWPPEVTQALEKEARLQHQLFEDATAGKIHISLGDQLQIKKSGEARNREFRELRYQDFVRDVNALEAIANKYLQNKSN